MKKPMSPIQRALLWWDRVGKAKARIFVPGHIAILAWTAGYRAARKDKHARLVEAEWLISELDNHEGCEGWSKYLQDRLDLFNGAKP
jgi:hypothetical protein